MGMTLHPKLSIGVAFDNFDRFVETLSGRNKLHDTVGVAYLTQRLPTIDEQEEEEQFSESGFSSCVADSNTVTEPMCQENEQSRKSKRRRQAYEAKGEDIVPYRKKPKLETNDFLPLNDPKRALVPDSLADAKTRDIVWMINHHVSPNQTPLWVGWNVSTLKDSTEMQKIWYLSPINH